MRDRRATLKNLKAIYNGKCATSNADKVYFIPALAYRNGDHRINSGDYEYITRAEFNRLTHNKVKQFCVETHPDHYLVW